jgi:hypothetical protein
MTLADSIAQPDLRELMQALANSAFASKVAGVSGDEPAAIGARLDAELAAQATAEAERGRLVGGDIVPASDGSTMSRSGES